MPPGVQLSCGRREGQSRVLEYGRKGMGRIPRYEDGGAEVSLRHRGDGGVEQRCRVKNEYRGSWESIGSLGRDEDV
jgi:hypothetical protein